VLCCVVLCCVVFYCVCDLAYVQPFSKLIACNFVIFNSVLHIARSDYNVLIMQTKNETYFKVGWKTPIQKIMKI
jgi:hypothetical protein